MDSTAVSAIAALFGGIVGAGLTNIITARLADQERKENRRKNRETYLSNILKRLIELRAELEYVPEEPKAGQAKFLAPFIQRTKAFGEAYALLKSISDREIRELASRIGGPDYLTDQIALNVTTSIEHNLGNDKDIRIDALDKAIERLGDLLDKAMG